MRCAPCHGAAYTGPATDGPTLKFVVYFAVPPSLAAEPSGAAQLLRAFLSGAASGHRVPGCEFYDRFKVKACMVDRPLRPVSQSISANW